MKLSNALLGMLGQLCMIVAHTFKPTLLALLRSPSLLIRPQVLSGLFFSHVWLLYGDGIDGNSKGVKEDLITPNAYGVVLDLGAGHGHTALYLSQSLVTKYVALEPNEFMHPLIRTTAERAGFSEAAGTLFILPCGAEDIATILSALGGPHTVDTLVAVRTLCSVPRPEETLRRLVNDILKPRGQLLFYEHGASQREDILFWQRFWAPVWRRFFGGCTLDRPTVRYIRNLGDTWEAHPGNDAMGKRVGIWDEEDEPEEHLFCHEIGRLIKRGT